MKTSRFQFEYREGASKLHKAVGELLRNSELFGSFDIYQEYPVNRVNKNYPESSHHFDWVIPKLMLVVECHGKQHYTPVAFDGDVDKAVEAFHSLRERDTFKKKAAIAAGFTYVEVPYTKLKTIDETWLLEQIKAGEAEVEAFAEKEDEDRRIQEERERREHLESLKQAKKEAEKERREEYLQSTEHKAKLRKAREFRQRQYRRAKELKKRNG